MDVVIFFEKDIGRRCLKILSEQQDSSVLAITTTKNGAVSPDLSAWCAQRKINLQIVDKPNEPAFLEKLRGAVAPYAFAISYSKIFKPELIEIFSDGIFNLHPALLPRHRGCFPTMWSIIEGDTQTGVTLHKVDPGLDTGPLVAQTTVPILNSDTGESLYARQVEAGEALFRDWCPRVLRSDYALQAQPKGGCYHNRIHPFGGLVPWQESCVLVERVVRAFRHSAYPGILTRLDDGRTIQVLGMNTVQEPKLLVPGEHRITGSNIYFRCKDATVRVEYQEHEAHTTV